MEEEMDSLSKNKTWELVDPPARQMLMSSKWIFKIKKGLKVILALTAYKDYELKKLDVKTTFLPGNIKESPRKWYRRFDEYMLSNGFKRSSYIAAYVTGVMHHIGSTKSLLKKELDTKELGESKKILGMKIIMDRSRKIMRVSQSGYISKIPNNFRIDNRKSVQMPLGGHFKLSLKDCPVRDYDVERMSKVPYANAVGSLMYLMVCMRPYISYAGTANVGLVYGKDRGNHVDVTCFVDSDYAKDPDKGRSITGYAFLVQRCVVSWNAALQHVVTLSTTKAEYMALTEAVKEAI
nr:retrotransposon protein, putative, Ty1-copia subclass [Tanacetum cinerariifolium]